MIYIYIHGGLRLHILDIYYSDSCGYIGKHYKNMTKSCLKGIIEKIKNMHTGICFHAKS